MSQVTKKGWFQKIPKVDELLKEERFKGLLETTSRVHLIEAIRVSLSNLREKIKEMDASAVSMDWFTPEAIFRRVEAELARRAAYHFRRVINATGVVIHTNLGRSLLADSVLEHMAKVAKSYSNLEYDLNAGKRGIRYAHVQKLLCDLTGAEDALVVNNNAGAVLIALNSLANGKEVVVSRGELVEIGGSFRIPDVMAWSGAVLKEVGTTNKTHLYDYEQAIHDQTGLLLKVHTSNFKLIGFVEQVAGKEVADLAHQNGLPAMEDLGSGNLVDFRKLGLPAEPTVQEALKQGMDVVTFSGDKLLGGPQAGIILGKKRYIELIQRNPLNRALRIDKLTLAGLEATLKFYEDPQRAIVEIPTLRMITQPPEALKRKARSLQRRLAQSGLKGFRFRVVASSSRVGGGAFPETALPTYCVAVESKRFSETQLESRLRAADPPVIARVEEGLIHLDVRTLLARDIKDLILVFSKISHEG